MEQQHDNDGSIVRLGHYNLLDLKKKEISSIVKDAEAIIKDGHYDPIKALVFAKKGKELFDQLEKAVRPIAEDQHKIGKNETYKLFDTELTVGDTGVRYDFTVCNDEQWNRLDADVSALTEQKKAREIFLRTLTKPMTIVDEDTGDINTINPPIRSGKEGLKVSLQ